MKPRHLFPTLLGGQFQIVLIVFSSLVAALTVALYTVIVARVAQDSLSDASFLALVQALNERLLFIALLPGVLAAIIAVPIARIITRPITELVRAHHRLAQGDMAVRVRPHGSGEVATLGRSFNSMAETLHSTQQELLQKERLASMGQLAAGVAHEINNPLSTILLFSEAALRALPADDSRRDDLNVIINETARCKAIVADLLHFSRQREAVGQPTDLHALLDHVIEQVSHQDSFREVRIVRRFSPDLPTIQSDGARLQQVFINLLNNAAEAIEGGGTVTLATRLLSDHRVEIQVSDTGCGIPEEQLGKLFTPFFTTKRPGKGTGLGLSIAHAIVRMHQGQIAVQSQVGKGTLFTVTLPVRLPQTGWEPRR